MGHLLIAASAIAATVVLGLTLAAVVLVGVAGRREGSAHSLSGRATGPVTGAARRLLGVSPAGFYRPASKAEAEVRFAHARRRLPAARQLPAGHQPGQGPGGPDRRQRAGV